MTVRRLAQSAIALGVIAIVSAIAQLAIVDADHLGSPLWGADVLGTWPLIALASVGLLTAVAVLASVARMVLNRDIYAPYAQVPTDEPAASPPTHDPEEASDG